MTQKAELGCVLYDDSCGFCRQWILFWVPSLHRRGFTTAPLQSAWVREGLGVSEEELVEDLRLLLPDGRQVRGADVYRYVMRRIWWAWPLYLFAIMPLGRQAFDWGYRTFARNRFRFSRTCGLRGGSAFAGKPRTLNAGARADVRGAGDGGARAWISFRGRRRRAGARA